MINMEIAKGYKKDTIIGQMRYPCEMYQEGIETEQKSEQSEEQKSDEEEE